MKKMKKMKKNLTKKMKSYHWPSGLPLRAGMLGGLLSLATLTDAFAADGFVGDGFGGRLWYTPGPLTTGGDTAAYIDGSGQLVMWGEVGGSIFPTTAEGGNESNTVTCPYEVAGETDVKLVDLTRSGLNVIVRNDGTAGFWSHATNSDGFTWAGEPYDRTIVTPPELVNITHASASTSHATFVRADGTVWTLGGNRYGAFGDGTTSLAFSSTPVQMEGINNAVRAIAFGANSVQGGSNANLLFRGGVVVLQSDGSVWVSGAGGSVGGTAAISSNAVQKVISNAVDIKVSIYNAFALTSDGNVFAWGENGSLAQPGLGGPQTPVVTVPEPQQINFPAGTPSIVAIEADRELGSMFALDEEGTLWGWGFQTSNGILGIDEATSINVPIRLAFNVADVDMGFRHAYMLRDGSFPEDERLLYSSVSGTTVYRILSLNPFQDPLSGTNIQRDNSLPTQWQGSVSQQDTWTLSRPSDMGVCGVIDDVFDNLPLGSVTATPGGGTDSVGAGTLAGTIDCDSSVILGSLVAGTASEVVLQITADITTMGVADFTISGSGFTLKTAPYTVGTTTTGEQIFYVPVLYDGTALGSVTFGISGLGDCTADLSGISPITITTDTNVIPIGTLCTAVIPAVLTK